jgi:hypothetical protein
MPAPGIPVISGGGPRPTCASTATRWPRTPTTVTPVTFGNVHMLPAVGQGRCIHGRQSDGPVVSLARPDPVTRRSPLRSPPPPTLVRMSRTSPTCWRASPRAPGPNQTKGTKAVRRARPNRSDVLPRGLRRPLPPRMAVVKHDPVLPTGRPGPDLHARPLPTER